MSNLFTTENIKKNNTKNNTYGVGEWVTRNGESAMRLYPAPFYKNYTVNDKEISYLLKDEFVPDTQYVFDFYIDTDDVIYNDKNVQGGLFIYYTDGTRDGSMYFAGGSKGFVHVKVVTPESKSVDHVEVGYYTNSPVYYRWDSYITPITDLGLGKSGLLSCGHIVENSDSVSMEYGGNIHLDVLWEY